jgi:hypothetical protein
MYVREEAIAPILSAAKRSNRTLNWLIKKKYIETPPIARREK